jgi:hypothetical protein
MTPDFNPNDIANTQGGGRKPPVFLPGIPGGGGFGTGEAEWRNFDQDNTAAITAATNRKRKELAESGGNQWEGWDFAKQGGGSGNPAAGGAPDAGMIAQNNQRAGLAKLSNQASGIPRASNQSVVSLAAPQSLPAAPGMATAGLNSLATKAKKPGNITLNQMYRK